MEKYCHQSEDLQFIAENVGFLDDSFDVSIVLESTLIAVKEYAIEERNICLNEKTIQNLSYKKPRSRDQSLIDNKNVVDENLLNTTNNIKSKKLCDWGLPEEIVKNYENKGIKEMFEWQVSCLGNSKILMDFGNLVYSAPTSAGKTLVAEILMIKTVLERQKKVIVILPFVSIVREKTIYLQDILSTSGLRVEGFMGSQAPPGGLQSVHIAICTIEKANSLVNRLLDEGNILDLGAVIVDELHLLGDQSRGYILELLLTKLKYVSSQFEGVNIQIIGMSATLPNLEILSKWLNAELYITQFRPIPLEEYCLVGNQLFNKHGDLVRQIDLSVSHNDNVLQICYDTIKEGCSILIFCVTKNWCESLAQAVALGFYKLGSLNNSLSDILREQLNTQNILKVLEQLQNCPVGLDQVLKKTISFGVAYHHAGLTFDERDIIEDAFKTGGIRVLVATSTLSSGVNLPARKVIIRSPVFQRQPINILSYKQMIGRAGRMGRDTMGESILICTDLEKKIAFDLMMGALNPVTSCLGHDDKYMRAVLEVIASQVANTKAELDCYTRCTLLFNQEHTIDIDNNLLNSTLEQLKHFELIRLQSNENECKYVATPLGKACLSSSMAPNDGLSLFCELQRARQCLVLETDLHLIYLVTPYSVSNQWGSIDWLHLFNLWESLTKAMRKVGDLVGVQESFIVRCVRGSNKLESTENKTHTHKRFYTALALQDLVNEVPLAVVAAKFQCPRGFLQSLQQAAATFAGMVTAFCRQLGWKNMEMLFSQFQDRLHFGIHSELLELMKLPSLNGMRARSLFNSGFETVSSIALADINVIENALHSAIPFQSEKKRDGEYVDETEKRNKINNIWVTGYCGLTIRQAAENLILEARLSLEREIGVDEIKWKKVDTLQDLKSKVDNISSMLQEKEKIQSNDLVPIKDENESRNIKSEEVLPMDIAENCISSEILITKQAFAEKEVHVLPFCIESVKKKANIDLSVSKQAQEALYYNKSTIQNDGDIWESLNISEDAFANISKLRVSDEFWPFNKNKIYIENKDIKSNIESIKTDIMCINNEDVNVFSSDNSNDSSLFEDSLPLDLLPNELSNCENSGKKTLNHEGNYNESSNILELAAQEKPKYFLEEEDDITLFYEEESDTDHSYKDEICCSQAINNEPEAKKIKMIPLIASNSRYKFPIPELKCPKSKKYLLHIHKTNINCFLLTDSDTIEYLRSTFNQNNMSIYFYDNITLVPISIGANIISENLGRVCINSNNNRQTLGIAIYYNNHEQCVFLDLNLSKEQMQLAALTLNKLLRRPNFELKLFSTKQTSLNFKKYLNIEIPCSCKDVALLEWLIDSQEKEPSIQCLAKKHLDVDVSTIFINNNKVKKCFANFDYVQVSCFKAWAIWHIAVEQMKILETHHSNVHNIIDIEVQVAKMLYHCEYNGIMVDKTLASRFVTDVNTTQAQLQNVAYTICGKHFNFSSPKEVAKILGIYNGRKVSTKKAVLNLHNTNISRVIMLWRKLNSILTKILYPITAKAVLHSVNNRIYPSYTLHTCSGRVSMHEPNLQNVPRKFSVPVMLLSPDKKIEHNSDIIEFNCRNIFKATPGFILVSADYCQLEMRILTHYCKDVILLKIMNSNVDVFTSIAASWASVCEEKVDDDLRQKAKQLCYGILYGMGSKTLGQMLDVSEMEASIFMDKFYKTYPAIKIFTQSVITECKKKGYIETLMKRRRYLPDINHKVISKRSSAERQAVNTTIQGSAADIAKAAMCAISKELLQDTEEQPRLILQLHDELIYEVPENQKNSFIKKLQHVMSNTITLNVPLPVKVKTGYRWGALEAISG